jgi:hypothetical protein
LGLTELNGGALFDAEFGIGHGATPYRKGQVLHSVFAAANSKSAATAQRLIAPNGMFLYDSAMAAHVTNVRNRETTLAVIIFSFSGISILIAAAAIYYRPRKECN